jgi:hypothetical protein
MRLFKLHECCTLQSCYPMYLLKVCRRFGGTYCPLFKADDWQSKRETVGASETSIFVRCDIPKDSVLRSVYNSRLEFRSCPVLFPTDWRMLGLCILYTVYVVLYTVYFLTRGSHCLNFICVVIWLDTPWICCLSINIHVAASWFGFLVLFLNAFSKIIFYYFWLFLY